MNSSVHLRFTDIFPLAPVHIANTRLVAAIKTSAHDHDFCELFIVNNGRVRHIHAQTIDILEKRTLCLVSPSCMHRFQNYSPDENSQFTNVAHFNTLFKARFGSSPREYRKKNRMIIDPV